MSRSAIPRASFFPLAVWFVMVMIGMVGARAEFPEKLDNHGLIFSTGSTSGVDPWVTQTDYSWNGNGGAKSGSPAYRAGSPQESWLETKVEGPDVITFQWRIVDPSELAVVNFTIDGAEEAILPDHVDIGWEKAVVPLGPGTHTLRWTYFRQRSSSGVSFALLDSVRLASDPWPLITSGSVLQAEAGQFFSRSLKASPAAEVWSALGLPVGVSLDAVTGVLSGIVTEPGKHLFMVTAANSHGSHAKEHDLTIHVPIAEALDAPGLSWHRGGMNNALFWMPQSDVSLFGGDAVQSSTLFYSASRPPEPIWMGTTVHGPDRLSFWWKHAANTEEVFNIFYQVDDGPRNYLNSPSDGRWQRAVVDVPLGNHTVRWTLLCNCVPENPAWIDQVRLDSEARPRVTSDARVQANRGHPISYQITATQSPQTYASVGLPAGMTVNEQTGLISGVPTETGIFDVTVTAINRAGSDTMALFLEVLDPIDEAVDTPGRAWTREANARTNWYPAPAAGAFNGSAARSGDVTQGLSILTTQVLGPDRLQFRYRFLKGLASASALITANGSPPLSVSLRPSEQWREIVLDIPSDATVLNFIFRNTGTRAGDSVMWLDALQLASELRPLITSARSAVMEAGRPGLYQIEATRQPSVFTARGLPNGILLDTATGIISGTPAGAGEYAVTMTAANASGETSSVVVIRVADSIAEALDAPDMEWRYAGGEELLWRQQVEDTADSEDALWLNAGRAAVSSFSTTFATAGTLRFRTKLYGHARLEVRDQSGLIVAALIGERDWTEIVIPVIENGVLVWSGMLTHQHGDRIGLDEVHLDSDPRPFIKEAGIVYFSQGTLSHYQLIAPMGTVFSATGLPSGLSLDSASGVLSGSPQEEMISKIAVTTTNALGSRRHEVKIVIGPTITEALDGRGLFCEAIESMAGKWSATLEGAPREGRTALICPPPRDPFSPVRVRARVTGPETLDFWWRVESISRGKGNLRVFVDGGVVFTGTAAGAWMSQSIMIPLGDHEIAWDFERTEGIARAWLDGLRLAGDKRPWLRFPDAFEPWVGRNTSLLLNFSRNAENAIADGLPPGLLFDPILFTVRGMPSEPIRTSAWLTGENAFGTAGAFLPVIVRRWPGEALEAPALRWDVTGTSDRDDWSFTTAGTHDGIDAMVVSTQGNPDGILETTVYGPTTMKWWWHTEVPDPNNTCSMALLLDATPVVIASGPLQWQQRSYTFPAGTWRAGFVMGKSSERASAVLTTGWIDQVEVDGYMGWVSQRSGMTSIDPAADIDGDGAGNFLEYAMGSDPEIPDARHGLQIMTDETGHLQISYAKPPGIGGVGYSMQGSMDLKTWNIRNLTTLQNDATLLRVRVNEVTSQTPRMFLRLRVVAR